MRQTTSPIWVWRLDNFNGQLVGLEDLLVFNAYDVDALINKATHADGVTIPAKLDWNTFTNTGSKHCGSELD